MNDLSPLVPWLFVVVGLALAMYAGRLMRGPKGIGGVITAGFVATVLGIGLTAATVWAHSACVISVHLCVSRGDGNMSYWFHSLIAVPAFWLLMLAFPSSDEPASTEDLTEHDSAIVTALEQFRKHQRVTSHCPSCGSTLTVEVPTSMQPVSRTSCRCGKCSGNFQLVPKNA